MKLVFCKMIALTTALMPLITGTSLKTPAKTPRKMNVLMIGNSLNEDAENVFLFVAMYFDQTRDYYKLSNE